VREIKFRAWSVSKLMNGTIREKMYSNDELIHWWEIPSPMLPFGFPEYDEHEESEWVWMQYTGFKDKNGKEIYEGDIVRCSGYEVRDGKQIGPARYEVVANSDKSWVVSCYRLLCLTDTDADRVEVIGNIYENPELPERPR